MSAKPFKPKTRFCLPTEPKNKMLSQKEIEFLRTPENFSIDYSYVLKHKIKSKVKAFNDELVLLERAGLIEFSKITENSKTAKSQNTLKLSSKMETEAGPKGFEPLTFSLEG